jgi:hypothetical protein
MWKLLELRHLKEITPFVSSALDRGLLCYNYEALKYLSNYKNQCLFKIEDDVLYLGRHSKIINTKYFKLYFSPIHIGGDEDKEKEALIRSLREGLSAWVGLEEAKRYKVDYRKVSEFRGGVQVNYHRAEGFSGNKNKNIRWEINRFNKALENNELEVVVDYPLERLSHLNDTWNVQKGGVCKLFGYAIKHRSSIDHLKNLTLLKDNKPITSSLYRCYTDHTWLCVGAISDYDKIPFGGLQRMSDIHIFNLMPDLQNLVVGGYKDDPLKKSKLGGGSYSLYCNVTCPSTVKMTTDMWSSFRPKKETYFEV